MLDATIVTIASALKRLLDKHVSVEEQCAQKYDRFLRGRHPWAFPCNPSLTSDTSTLWDLFNTRWQNDDVQDFDVRWDQALLSASGMPSDVILEGLYKWKLQDSVQLQTVLALYESRNRSKQWTNELFKIEDFCESSFWSNDENSNFQSPERSCWERSSDPQSKRKESLRREESGRVFSVESTWKMFKVVSVMTSLHKETCAVFRDKKDDCLLLQEGKIIKNRPRRIPCRDKNCNNPSCRFWHSSRMS